MLTPTLSCNTPFLKSFNSFECHISLNVLPFSFPASNVASLSKQQGTTRPSHVITDVRHNAKQWFCRMFFILKLLFSTMYLLYFVFVGRNLTAFSYDDICIVLKTTLSTPLSFPYFIASSSWFSFCFITIN